MENKTKIFEALSKAQAKFPLLSKNKKGHGYDYADIGEVLITIRKILFEEGLSIYHEEIYDNNVLLLKSHLCHSSGESVYTTTVVEYDKRLEVTSTQGKSLRNNLSQAKGSALTYARRYAIYNLLNLGFGIEPQDEDDDGDKSAAEAIKESINEPIKEPTTLNRSQLEALSRELVGHDDLLKTILTGYKIDKLALVPYGDFLKLMERVKKLKLEKEMQ